MISPLNETPMIDAVRRRLQELGRQEWPAVHEATGVPLSSIEKIAYGVHTDPHISTLEPLYRHLRNSVNA